MDKKGIKKFLETNLITLQELFEIKTIIDEHIQKKRGKSTFSLRVPNYPLVNKQKDKNKGAFVAFLSYNAEKSSVKRFFVKPKILFYSNEKRYQSLLFNFEGHEGDIIEVRLEPRSKKYYLVKRNFLRRKRKKNKDDSSLKLKKIGREKAFNLLAGRVFFIEEYLKLNPRVIPSCLKNFVWNRDHGRCAKCGSTENLEFDHVIPVSKGGATSEKNLQLLCKECNLRKASKLR